MLISCLLKEKRENACNIDFDFISLWKVKKHTVKREKRIP